MVISHSYVSLPEGSWENHRQWIDVLPATLPVGTYGGKTPSLL